MEFGSDISAIQDRPGGLQMVLPAKAENVAVVRHALAGLAEQLGMNELRVADLKTVVTEACMNVVVHAYRGRLGPLNVEAVPDQDGLTVTVRDEGIGFRPQAESDRDSLRLGLSLIAALSGSFSIAGGLDRGTEITMRMPLRGDSGDPVEIRPISEEERTEVIIDRSELLTPVLARVVSAFVARRELSVDRVSDAVLVSDAIAGAAPERFADGRVRLRLEEHPTGIDLRLGPLEPGAVADIRKDLEVPEVGGSLELLADELTVEKSDDGEYLIIRFVAAP